MSLKATNLKLDRVGMVASGACAVHCAITPFVAILLPFGGITLTGGSALETLFVTVSVLFGTASARIGLRLHNSRKPVVMVLLGGFMIASGRLASFASVWPETTLVVSGACMIAGAHAVNLYLCRCRACHAAHVEIGPGSMFDTRRTLC
jgi:hypothetical protein